MRVQSGSLMVRVHCIEDDIDDYDRDALRIVVEVTNEGVDDADNLAASMRTMDGGKVPAFESATTVAAGLREDFSFFVPLDSGAWLFKIEHDSNGMRMKAELGPYSCDVRIAETIRKPVRQDGKGSAVGGSAFESAFGAALTGFGDEPATPEPVAASAPETVDPMATAFGVAPPHPAIAEVAPTSEPEVVVPALALAPLAPVAPPISTPAATPELVAPTPAPEPLAPVAPPISAPTPEPAPEPAVTLTAPAAPPEAPTVPAHLFQSQCLASKGPQKALAVLLLGDGAGDLGILLSQRGQG